MGKYNTNGESIISKMLEIVVQYILCDHAVSPVARE
jgi:hypothetical protein